MRVVKKYVFDPIVYVLINLPLLICLLYTIVFTTRPGDSDPKYFTSDMFYHDLVVLKNHVVHPFICIKELILYCISH